MSPNRILLAMIAIGFLTSLCAGNDNPRSFSISGRVLDGKTRTPIASANVVLVGSGFGAATDQNGRFSIVRLPKGKFEVRVSVVGYSPGIKQVLADADEVVTAHEFLLDESDINIEGVEAVGEKFVRSSENPVSTRSLSLNEMRNTAGGLDDVVRAVRIIPGVAQSRPERTDLVVRGGAPSENLFLIDNLEVPYINHFSTQGAGGGAVSIVDMELISSSSFSTGGFGVRYGDKLSSVLNIGVREGNRESFHGKAAISATQFGLNAEGPLSEDGSYLVSVRRSYLDLVFKAYGFGFAPQYWDFLGKASTLLGPDDKLSVLVIGAIDKMDIFNDSEQHRYENSQMVFSSQNHLIAGVTWRHMLTNGFSTLTASHTRSSLSYQQFTPDLASRFQSSSIESETSVRGDAVIQLSPNSKISGGAEVTSVDVNRTLDSHWGKRVLTNQSLRGGGKAAAYAQVAKRIDGVVLSLGVRADYCSFIDDRAVVAPRFSSAYAISPATGVTLSVGRYYQTPSYVWLTANPANRRLLHIGADQFILGVDHLVSEALSVSVEGYIKKYFNYPVSLNDASLIMSNTGAENVGVGKATAAFGIADLASLGTGTAQGVELSVQKKMSDIPCYGMASVSYSSARFTALDGISRPSDYDQRLIVNIGGGYIAGEKWEFSGKFRFYTGHPYTPLRADGSEIDAEYNAARVGANYQLDIRVMRRWALGLVALETYVDVQNVFNRKPVDTPVYDERERSLKQAPALGIVPTLGVSVRF